MSKDKIAAAAKSFADRLEDAAKQLAETIVDPVCHAAVEQNGHQQQKLDFKVRAFGIPVATELWVDVATKRLVRQKVTTELASEGERLKSISDANYRYDPTITIVAPK